MTQPEQNDNPGGPLELGQSDRDSGVLLTKQTTKELKQAARDLDAAAVRIELIADTLRPSSERWYVLLVEYAGDIGRLLAEVERMAHDHGWPEAVR